MKLLITNDDGIEAKGIKILEEISKEFFSEIITVAPLKNQSGKSRSLTLYENVELCQIDKNHYWCKGTPTDCVILSLNLLYKDSYPDYIFSGINHGFNIADDVGYSGTIAAAFEGATNGIPSIAFSQGFVKEDSDFLPSINHGKDVIKQILNLNFNLNKLINVNFPSSNFEKVKGIRRAKLDNHKIGDVIYKTENSIEYKIGPLKQKRSLKKYSDRWWLNKGYITMTPLLLDTTDNKNLKNINEIDF